MTDDDFEEKSTIYDKTGWSANGTRQVYHNGEHVGEEYSPLEADKASKASAAVRRRRNRPAGPGDSYGPFLTVLGFVFKNIPFVIITWFVAQRLLPRQFVWYARWIIGGAAGFGCSIGLIWLYTFADCSEGLTRRLLLPVRILTVAIVCGAQAAIAFTLCYRFIGGGPLSFPPEIGDLSVRYFLGIIAGLPAGYLTGRWAWRIWYG